MKKYRKRILKRTINSIVTALGILIAVAWNGAIRDLFDLVFSKGEGLIAKFSYAIVITVIVVLIIIQVEHLK